MTIYKIRNNKQMVKRVSKLYKSMLDTVNICESDEGLLKELLAPDDLYNRIKRWTILFEKALKELEDEGLQGLQER